MRTLVFTLLISIFVIAFSFSEVNGFEEKDIVLAISFDEGKGEVAKDLSPLGNDGVLKGKPKWVDGKFGKALSLDPEDGDVDYVEIPNESDYDFEKTDSFTFACWAKLSPKAAGDKNHFVISKMDAQGIHNGIALIGFNDPNSALFTIQGDNGWTAVNGNTPVIDEKWHHMAIVNDGSKGGKPNGMKVYVDGKPEQTKVMGETVGKSIQNDAPLAIGVKGGLPAQVPTKGIVDEVLVVKRALTDDEIRRHFNGGLAGVLAVKPSGKLPITWGSIKASHSISQMKKQFLLH